jgi:hypothetical protein
MAMLTHERLQSFAAMNCLGQARLHQSDDLCGSFPEIDQRKSSGMFHLSTVRNFSGRFVDNQSIKLCHRIKEFLE